jgi:predicted alpha/beta hydrolase family esterase
MKNAIILHGKPSKQSFYDPNFPSSSNYYWLPWLQKQLVLRDIPTSTPEVPNNWIANYKTWLEEFERYEVTPDTILVGHSCGAGFLLRWLSENQDIKVGQMILVAPWINPLKLENTDDFFDFTLDQGLSDRTNESVVISSDDDEEGVLATVKILQDKADNFKFVELKGQGHFFDNRKMEFPELLEVILS